MMYKIEDSELNKSSVWALIEANKYDRIARKIKENGYDSQIAVIYCLASELYLKAILMKKGKNVTKVKIDKNIRSHSLAFWYKLLDDYDKDEIKNKTNFDSIKKINPLFPEIIYEFKTFEDALEKISNDFVDLRYEYEKFANGESIYVMNNFIEKFEKGLKEVANKNIIESGG